MTLPKAQESSAIFGSVQPHYYSSTCTGKDFYISTDGRRMSSRDFGDIVTSLNGEIVDVPLDSSSDDDECVCCCCTGPHRQPSFPLILFPCFFLLMISMILFIVSPAPLVNQ